MTVYKAVVRSSLLVGLEAVALSREMLEPMEKFQNKKMRQLMCGDACIKTVTASETGETKTKFRVLSNKVVRERLGLPTIFSEMCARRVKWLQNMCRHPRDSSSTLAVLQDSFLWERKHRLMMSQGCCMLVLIPGRSSCMETFIDLYILMMNLKSSGMTSIDGIFIMIGSCMSL